MSVAVTMTVNWVAPGTDETKRPETPEVEVPKRTAEAAPPVTHVSHIHLQRTKFPI